MVPRVAHFLKGNYALSIVSQCFKFVSGDDDSIIRQGPMLYPLFFN